MRRILIFRSDNDITMINNAYADEQLVGRAKAGERGAFDALATRYRDRLLHLTRRYAINEADAEDIVQDSLLRAFRGLDSYRGAAQFYTWLYRIAENSAKSALIGRLRRTRLFLDVHEKT